uniref:Uncharacterized protein n=1 Tax=Aegilops tauschii subsp. strangulata TaxID=200361 RepID=A0A453D672_AEGTS
LPAAIPRPDMSSSGAGEEGAAAPQGPLPVEHRKGANGLDKVVLREARRISAEVYLYGGHVTSWKDEHGEELLFVSNKVPLFSLSTKYVSAFKILSQHCFDYQSCLSPDLN